VSFSRVVNHFENLAIEHLSQQGIQCSIEIYFLKQAMELKFATKSVHSTEVEISIVVLQNNPTTENRDLSLPQPSLPNSLRCTLLRGPRIVLLPLPMHSDASLLDTMVCIASAFEIETKRVALEPSAVLFKINEEWCV
jgi:hypothetical protein